MLDDTSVVVVTEHLLGLALAGEHVEFVRVECQAERVVLDAMVSRQSPALGGGGGRISTRE